MILVNLLNSVHRVLGLTGSFGEILCKQWSNALLSTISPNYQQRLLHYLHPLAFNGVQQLQLLRTLFELLKSWKSEARFYSCNSIVFLA